MGSNPYYDEDPDHALPSRYEKCPNCGHERVFPVESQRRYWAERVGERLDRLWGELEHTIDWLDDLFPSVPIREAIDNRCEELRRAIVLSKKALDNELTLEEECELENLMQKYSEDHD